MLVVDPELSEDEGGQPLSGRRVANGMSKRKQLKGHVVCVWSGLVVVEGRRGEVGLEGVQEVSGQLLVEELLDIGHLIY